MFYCDPCAEKRDWPRTLLRSSGPCEVCGGDADCNDCPSKYLPLPRPQDNQPVEVPFSFSGERVGTARVERDEAGVRFTARLDKEIPPGALAAAPVMSFSWRGVTEPPEIAELRALLPGSPIMRIRLKLGRDGFLAQETEEP